VKGNGGPRWRWERDPQSELALVKAVKAEEVWAQPYGEQGKVWVRVAARFQRLYPTTSSTKLPAQASYKDHYSKLYERRKKLDSNPSGRSGSSEQYEELDQVLTECIEATESWVQKAEEVKKKQQAKKDETESTQKRLRTHTLQSLSQRSSTSPVSTTSSPSSSSSSSAEVSSGELKSNRGDRPATDGEGHPKRLKPSLKLQQEQLTIQKDTVKLMGEQFTKLASAAETQTTAMLASNDLFAQFIQAVKDKK
jgi:hypothetical protein